MKRFYKTVSVEKTPDGFRILLDGKVVKTPGRRILLLPTRALANGIAEEWRAQGEDINAASMPMLRLANTALDGVASTRNEVIAAILRFGEHDLICYRAEEKKLASRQRAAWDPMLDWAASRHGARFEIGAGVVHIAQPAETLARLRLAIAGHDDFALAALHMMASIAGSLVLALAVAEGKIDVGSAFQLSRLDEDYQAELWGRDEEAAARGEALAREMAAAAAFLAAARD
jgi:chaperone required for assembly of F1-ATPase